MCECVSIVLLPDVCVCQSVLAAIWEALVVRASAVADKGLVERRRLLMLGTMDHIVKHLFSAPLMVPEGCC